MLSEKPELHFRFWKGFLKGLKGELEIHKEIGPSFIEKNDLGQRVGKREWGNVSWHCLCVAARAEIMAEWLGLSPDLVANVKKASFLHDYDKPKQVKLFRRLNNSGEPQLQAVNEQTESSLQQLKAKGYNDLVVWLASAAGGMPSELIESKKILDKQELTDEDLAYLICHLADDISSGSRSVRPISTRENRQTFNEVDFRAEENEKKTDTDKLARERELYFKDHPYFAGLKIYDAMAKVSHLIEQCLAEEVLKRTGEKINPTEIPEKVDRKLQEKLNAKPVS